MPDPERAAQLTGSTSGIGLAIALRLARSSYSASISVSKLRGVHENKLFRCST